MCCPLTEILLLVGLLARPLKEEGSLEEHSFEAVEALLQFFRCCCLPEVFPEYLLLPVAFHGRGDGVSCQGESW